MGILLLSICRHMRCERVCIYIYIYSRVIAWQAFRRIINYHSFIHHKVQSSALERFIFSKDKSCLPGRSWAVRKKKNVHFHISTLVALFLFSKYSVFKRMVKVHIPEQSHFARVDVDCISFPNTPCLTFSCSRICAAPPVSSHKSL